MPSGGSGGGTNTVETQSGPPAQVLANYQNVFGQAQNVSQQPYPTYDGSLVAGFTPQQTAGFNNINTAVNAGAPFLNAASQATTNAATSLDPQNFGSTVQSYYNPYAQGVIAPTEAQFNQQNAIQQNQLSSQAGSAGAFGGDRLGVAEGVLGGQQQLAEAPQLAQLEATGYNQAATNAQSNAWLNSQAGFGFGNLGNEAQSLGLQGANAQLSAGAQQQQQAQQELNAPYQQFLAAQGYPYQATNFLNSIATGTGSLSGQQGSTTSPGPSALSQVAGAGLAGAGLLGQTGAFGANGWLTGAGAATAAGVGTGADAALATGVGAGVAESGLDDAAVAALLAKRGGRIEDVIRSMRGIHIPRRDDGGSVNPAQTAAFAGNPLNSNLYSIYSRLPTEKLQELAVRSPQNTMVTRALHMRQMNPQADPSVQTPGLAPAQASGMGAQQPLGQQPLGVTPAQTQAAPGGFASGGWVHRDDGGLLDYDSLADQNDPPPMLGGLAPSSLGSRTPPIPGLGDTAGGMPDVGAGIPTQPITAGLSIPIAAQPPRGRDTGEPLPQSATLASTNSDFSEQSDHPSQTSGMGIDATHSSGPWNTLIAAGLGILGGTSPHPGVNIGQGGLKGLEFAEQQKQREQQAQFNNLYRQGLLGVRTQQVGVNQQRANTAADIGQQNVDVRNRSVDVRQATADRAAQLKAQGMTDAQANAQARLDIARNNSQTNADYKGVRLGQIDEGQAQRDRALDQGAARVANSKVASDARLALTQAGQDATTANADVGAASRMVASGAVKDFPTALKQVQSSRTQAPKPTAQTPASPDAVPPSAVEYLKAHPELAPQFKQKYGVDPSQYLAP